MARAEMRAPFVLLNGDTVFDASVCASLLQAPPAPITIAIDRKPHYDADDMKVKLRGSRLSEIGKTLASEDTDGESIGMIRFSEEGAQTFVETLDRVIACAGQFVVVVPARDRDHCRQYPGRDALD